MKRKIFAVLVACLFCVGLSQAVFAAQGGQGNSGFITMEAAQKIALDHAKANAANVTFTKLEMDRDHGVTEYEISFRWNNLKYEYEIDAVSGAITGYSQETPKQVQQASGNGNYIGIDAAKEIALKHAGVTAAQASFTKVKLDRHRKRGTAEYEIKFLADGKRYECEIDAASGKVLEYSVKMR